MENRGIGASIHQWEDSPRVEVGSHDDGGGRKMVVVKVWMPFRTGDCRDYLDMTNFEVAFREETAILVLQQLARLYPTACAETGGGSVGGEDYGRAEWTD